MATQLGIHRSKKELHILFSNQMKKLRELGFPAELIQKLARQRQRVVAKASTLSFGPEHIPFVPIIHHTAIGKELEGLEGLMSYVRHHDEQGIVQGLKGTPFSLKTPARKCYFIFDVEQRSRYIGRRPDQTRINIRRRGRAPLEVWEAIAVCIHSNALAVQHIDSATCWGPHRHSVLTVFGGERGPSINWQWSNAGQRETGMLSRAA